MGWGFTIMERPLARYTMWSSSQVGGDITTAAPVAHLSFQRRRRTPRASELVRSSIPSSRHLALTRRLWQHHTIHYERATL